MTTATQTTSFIETNRVQNTTRNYLHTSLVSHRSVPISFAMTDDGQIFYSVLDLNSSQEGGPREDDNDKLYWSQLNLTSENPSRLNFPQELSRVGYSVVPNRKIGTYDSSNRKIIHSYDKNGVPLDERGNPLTEETIKSQIDRYYSSTARLGAAKPFQALSDGKYVYLFRQSIASGHPNSENPPQVNTTLLVDRFVLSGSVLKLSKEIRYQRSGHKTEPASRKDTLSGQDMEGNPFYEPTRELAFVNNLTDGNFSVLLIPGADSEEKRWQIFSHDSQTKKINSFNIRYDDSIVFDTSDSQAFVDEMLTKYGLGRGLVSDVQVEIKLAKSDEQIAVELLARSPYSTNGIPEDALAELVYTLRTGAIKDDFRITSTSTWPLIEYNSNGTIAEQYTHDNGVLKDEFSFHGARSELKPYASRSQASGGLSACYYYQQEMDADNKPMKNKACVMLAIGLDDSRDNHYIGILNFSVAKSGRLSRLTTDAVNLPDINVQALDENPYRDLNAISGVMWQPPQKMHLLDIDPDGLSTSGGILRFAYTSSDFASQYTDATEAYDPHIFDDSLGRVNLYFRGKNNNFFVLYFNPHGAKSVTIRRDGKDASPPLVFTPRLDRDMEIAVEGSVFGNSSSLTLKSAGEAVETWARLPKRFSQIAAIMNGDGVLHFANLEPLGDTQQPTLGYNKSGTIRVRTTVVNNLAFTDNALAVDLADGKVKDIALGSLSSYLAHNPQLFIAKKSFSLVTDQNVGVKAAMFFRSYLVGAVDTPEDMTKLWGYLATQELLQPLDDTRANLRAASLTGSADSLTAKMSGIESLNLDLLQTGSDNDKKARLARVKQALVSLLMDVAKVRTLTLKVVDTNAQHVDSLEAGLPVSTAYNYANFTCDPMKLRGTSADKWEHARSYLFDVSVAIDATTDATTEIDASFNYQYHINNTIGQWEDWDASLALQLNPTSATDGALLTTDDSEKLKQLEPTEKGLSVEAWIKPSAQATTSSIVYYRNGEQQYSLGIEKQGSAYACVATIGAKKYRTKTAFQFTLNGREYWKHLAFTHKKYWGYKLQGSQVINCGNDSSLNLPDEFTVEIMAQLDTAGTILKKSGQYHLRVKSDKTLSFQWGATEYLEEWLSARRQPSSAQQNDTTNYRQRNSRWQQRNAPGALPGLNQFYKITVIRSSSKPVDKPAAAEYPISSSSNNSSSESGPKWYEDKSGDELIRGMAEKQDQLETKLDVTSTNVFGVLPEQQADGKPEYYYTVIVMDGQHDTPILEWTSTTKREAASVESFDDFLMGGDGFAGAFAEVRVWNRALAKSEAKALPMPDNNAGLRSRWRINEGKGKYLYDDISENHGAVALANGWTDNPQPGLPSQLIFYVDGSRVQTEQSKAPSTTEPNQLSVGGIKRSGSADHFNGCLEEIRIWNLPRTAEQISDNAFGRLKGEWEQLLANYTFDMPMEGVMKDASTTSAHLTPEKPTMLREILSTAPVATEIPQVRSALTGVVTDYNESIRSRPSVVEYGDIQRNDDGTFNGILKRCYSFVDGAGQWNRVTGYKVGNLVSQWYGQAQFAPQVVGYLEGPPPVPGENFPINNDSDVNIYAYRLDNSVEFHQAEEVSYNYSTSKEAGWNVGVTSEANTGIDISTLIAPLGFGLSFELEAHLATESKWETSGQRSQSFERGVSVNTSRAFSASLAGYDNGKSGKERFYKLGNTGYALVKSKTADIYLLRLAHNNALVSISWQPNPDIPEDVNIIPFPINPLYTKQGTLDGKVGESVDEHYPQAHGAYGEYSYFKPREAYQLKKEIEREKMRLRSYFEDSFDVSKTNTHFQVAAATTGLAQLATLVPVAGPLIASSFNQVAGQLATQVGYNNTKLKDDLANIGSQRNLVNTYVWTVEGGFFAESTEVAQTQQETYANTTSLSLGGGLGAKMGVEGGGAFEQKTLFSSGSSFTLTKSRTKESSSSFGLNVSVSMPTSPRYKYSGVDGRSLSKGLIAPGTVDAYRFMSFYLEPHGKHFTDLFTEVIDQKWIEESPDPNAQALRQARGDVERARPCWRIMHRVTYVSRILPEFQPEAPPSLEKSIRASGLESNYMLIKRFEPYVAGFASSEELFSKIDQVIDTQLVEFQPYRRQIKRYLALYYDVAQI